MHNVIESISQFVVGFSQMRLPVCSHARYAINIIIVISYINPLPTHSCAAGTPRGQIYMTAEEMQDSKFNIQLQFSASNLDKKDFFGKVSGM